MRGHPETRRSFSASDYLTGDTFVVRETAAGWWATTPVPDDMALYYPQLYYGESGRRFPAPIEWLQAWLYRRRSQWVSVAAGTAGRVLDVGCGPGHLLARFRAGGWGTVGTEATESSAAIPRERYGLDVRAGDLQALNLEGESFDAVVSWHTLEHMRDPLAVLTECSRLLRPGGLLLLSVPNFSSPEAQAKPAAWFHLDVPRHLAHFPVPVLRGALAEQGFTIEKESYWAPEYDTFSLLQTWQNRLGLPHNLLYLVLKSASGRAGPPPTAWQRVAAILLGAALLPVAAVVTLWRALAGRGAVVVLLARKVAVGL